MKDILESYLNSEIDSIPELEEDRLFIDCRKENDDSSPLHACHNIWSKLVTVNVL